ncbi:MAG: glycosyltransferase involved in cell wall biosynthesis [Cyclobacteriaceae bacterium]|jgi:glycosyltransferase involved in cell wall biosynthesis
MSLYLDRYGWPQSEFPEFIPDKNLEIIVIIPCYNEPDLIKSLRSLEACTSSENVLVMVIINESEFESDYLIENNRRTIEEISSNNFTIPILSKLIPLPDKKAGVGLARKIGMDEAVRKFESIKKDGIIVCFDADCLCAPNYFEEIKKFYSKRGKKVGLVHYEHDLSGDNIEAIINYELYLRYYVNAMRWAKFPFAFQTLGSCITVRSKAYQKQGGMNTRQAAEDFYFIHKMMPLGGIGELNATCIYPSDRVSDRVPFGTGQAVAKFLNQENDGYEVYNPRIFAELKQFLETTFSYLFDFPDYEAVGYSPNVVHFLKQINFNQDLKKMRTNASNSVSFMNRFFQWFDGFRALKFVHFMRDHYYENIDIIDALGWLNHQHLKLENFDGTKEMKLILIRKHDQEAGFYIK